MLSAPGLVHEELRLAAVAEYGPHRAFDEGPYAPILDMACDLFNVPTAFVSLLDRHEQIFAARRGLTLCKTNRDISFCAHAVAQNDILVVLDASLDPRFHDNPLVTGDPAIRFYAGTPLRSPTGHAVGTLCVADVRPHNGFSDANRNQLRHLAAMVVERLEVRRLLLASETGQRRFENIAATSPDSIICADADSIITFWNGAAERLFGHSSEEAIGQNLDLIVPSRLRKGHHGGLKRVAGGAAPRLVGKVVELAAQHADGHEFPIELSLSMWQEENGANFGAILRDITDRRIKEEQLFRLAHHDALSELPNRSVLHRRIEQLNGGVDSAALLVIDLDGFKTVTDDLGHAAGAAVLREISRRLIGCVRSTDTVARLGGDEFALLLPGVGDIGQAGDIAHSVMQALSQPIELAGTTVSVGASIGIAIYVQDGPSSDELLSSADLALQEARAMAGIATGSTRPSCARPRIALARTIPSCAVPMRTVNSRCSTNLRSDWPTACWSARKRCCAGGTRGTGCYRRRPSWRDWKTGRSRQTSDNGCCRKRVYRPRVGGTPAPPSSVWE